MKVTIIKQNHQGEETWRYNGQIVERGKFHLVVEAFFDRADMDFHGMCLCKGDRFVETYYFDRWYNVFEIYGRKDLQLKGWYCNISSPAVERENVIVYKDLALDLLIFPDGRQIILDEDEFAELALSADEQQKAMDALAELQFTFEQRFRALD